MECQGFRLPVKLAWRLGPIGSRVPPGSGVRVKGFGAIGFGVSGLGFGD